MNDTRYLRTGLLAALVLACTTLLSACSLWSKMTSAPAAESTAAQVPPPPAVVAPAPCTDCAEAAKPAAVAVPQSPAAPVALSPMPPAGPAATVAEPAARAPMAATTPATPAAKSITTSALAPGFYINAGLYAVPDNANRAYRKLETAGLPVFTEVVTSKGEQRTRVRVGPYSTRAKADAAAKKIRALKLDAAIFKH